MNIFDAIILGVVEGVTEFLPVSSTGHLILTAELLGLPITKFLTTFEVVIQLGAILAVVTLYFKKFLLDWKMNQKLLVALLPSLVIGVLFYPFIKKLFAAPIVVAVSLVVGGVIIILVERWLNGRKPVFEQVDDITFREAFFIGCFQALSVIPGVSRAGATILGGLVLGAGRSVAVEFSFLLAVPTMVAASTKDLYENGSQLLQADLILLGAGFLTAYIVALAVIKLFIRFVQTNTFIPFGWYRILVGLIFLIFVL